MCAAVALNASAWKMSNTPYSFHDWVGTYRTLSHITIALADLENPYTDVLADYEFADDHGLKLCRTNETSVVLPAEVNPDNRREMFLYFNVDKSDITNTTIGLTVSNLNQVKVVNRTTGVECAIKDVIGSAGTRDSYNWTWFSARDIDDGLAVLEYPVKSTMPGEHTFLYGTYEFRMIGQNGNSDPGHNSCYFAKYHQDNEAPVEGKLIDESGDSIAPLVFTYHENVLALTLNEKITAPGEYYMIAPTNGYFDYSNSGLGGHHISYQKFGPYNIVEEGDASEMQSAVFAYGQTIYNDNLSAGIGLTVTNAAALSLNPGASNNVNVKITSNHNATGVTAEVPIAVRGNEVVFLIPEELIKTPDNYFLNITSDLNTVLSGITSDHQLMDFTKKYAAATYSFTVLQPQSHEDEVGYYVKGEPMGYELAEDETALVRLQLPDSADGCRIYYRWTPADTGTLTTNADAADGFAEHTGDIKISGPGTLDYYTRVSNTSSPIRSINFTVKNDDTSEVVEINGVRPDDGEGEPVYYDLAGRRRHDVSLPGIYIRSYRNGASDKVLVR